MEIGITNLEKTRSKGVKALVDIGDILTVIW